MFVQCIEGVVHDPGALRALYDRWLEELAPGAPGWLGSTAGVNENGTCFVAARFASVEDAGRNSDRPEQGAWWGELVEHFDETPAVSDCSTVEMWRGGGRDDAGFVQVMIADVLDGDALRAAVTGALDAGDDGSRPDVIGAVLAVADDDSTAYMIVYFASEEAARAGEAEDETSMGDDPAWGPIVAALGEPRFLDLRDPWLASP
jgi:hypothetical protein